MIELPRNSRKNMRLEFELQILVESDRIEGRKTPPYLMTLAWICAWGKKMKTSWFARGAGQESNQDMARFLYQAAFFISAGKNPCCRQ